MSDDGNENRRSKPDRFEKARQDKLDKIVAMDLDPFGQRFDDHVPITDARNLVPDISGEVGPDVRIAGRVMFRRKAGKLRFYVIKDQTGTMQLLFSRGDLSEEQWALMGHMDLGDLIGIDGKAWRTDSGEPSVKVEHLTMLCKSLAQPPEKYNGLKDEETKLRQRYKDLIYGEGVLDRLLQRSSIVDSVRQTLRGHRFNEVETPVLHAVAGGPQRCRSRPITTRWTWSCICGLRWSCI